MPIALSNWPITKQTFTSATVASFIATMNTHLTSVGWLGAVVPQGFKYHITSPQGLQIYCYLRDLGHGTGIFGTDKQATFTFETLDGTITGLDHDIVIRNSSPNDFILIAGKSQMALAKVGVHNDLGGSSIVCGIPFIPDEDLCDGWKPSNPTDQCFIAMSDMDAGGSPRAYLILGAGSISPENQFSCEALWGTSYCAEGNYIGSIRLTCLTCAPYIFQGFNYPCPDIWATKDFWRMEPFLAWGLTEDKIPVLRAQLWDSMIFAKSFVMDHEVAMDQLNWYVFTDNYFYGVLAFNYTSTGTDGTNTTYGIGGDLGAFIYD